MSFGDDTLDPANKEIQELTDLRSTFDLMYKADRRAIERWRKDHPDRDLILPDRADLVYWLIEQYDLELRSQDAEIRRIAEALSLPWPTTIEAIVKEINQTSDGVTRVGRLVEKLEKTISGLTS